MPEAYLFGAPLTVTPRRGPDVFPTGWVHHQVTMPSRAGVDAVAGAVQLVGPGDSQDEDIPLAAAVRHWCGEDIGQLSVRSATAAELTSEGSPVLRVDDLELHDPHLLDLPGCPLVAVDDDTPLLWVAATKVQSAEEPTAGWVPYGQSVVRWVDRDRSQPVAHTMNMAGLGSARDRDEAIERACEDLIAQDAVMTWWLHGLDQPLPVVLPACDLVQAWGRSPLELRLRTLPSPSGVRAVLAAVLDPDRGVATMSPAAGPNAAAEAASQALWQHAVAHDLLSRNGDLHRTGTPGLLPHRPDRNYLVGAGPGLRQAVDPVSNVQLGLDPSVLTRIDERTSPWSAAEARVEGHTKPLAALTRAGHEVWVVDLTTPEVAAAGWHCVRVISTDLARIPVAAFPLDPMGRTSRAASSTGLGTTCFEPLPYPGW